MEFKNIKEGELENQTHRRCNQIQCVYYVEGGCQTCEECNSEPYVISKGCQSCHSCENEENEIRWGETKKQKLKNKVCILEASQ